VFTLLIIPFICLQDLLNWLWSRACQGHHNNVCSSSSSESKFLADTNFLQGLQELLDLLWSVNGSISECAALLGSISTTSIAHQPPDYWFLKWVCQFFYFVFCNHSHPFGVPSLLKNKLFCRLSTGALSRLIVSDRTVWNAVNNLRISHVSHKALMLECIWQILDYTHTHIYVYVSLKKHVDFVGIKLY
jgi:hypothetical protein